MVEIWPKLSEQGTWSPFRIPMFGELNVMHNNYELGIMDTPIVREVILNGKRIWLHPDIIDSIHSDLKIARDWAIKVVKEELDDTLNSKPTAHPVHDGEDTQQAKHVEQDDEDCKSPATPPLHVAAPLILIDIEVLK